MWQEIIYPVAFVLLVLLPAPLLGNYLYRVFEGKSRWLAPLERATLACCGTDGREQDWKSYALSLLAFNGAGFGLLFLILLAQGLLPLNPQQLPGLNWQLAFNTAVSFMTNTNWQAYSGEASLSLLQPDGGAHHPELRLPSHRRRGRHRPVSRHRPPADHPPGNFWQDLVRFCLYVLLPMALILALLLVWQGCPRACRPTCRSTPWKVRSSCCRSARPPPRSPSSSSAPTAAASSASTRPIRSKPHRPLQLAGDGRPADPGRRHGLHPGSLREGSGHSRAILIAMTIMLVLGLCLAIGQELKPDPPSPTSPAKPATGKARRAASAPCCPASGKWPPPLPPTARSTPCTTASPPRRHGRHDQHAAG